MVSMASFGALTAVLMGNSERIAKEREKGWVRQLRLTSLPGRGYVLAKIAQRGRGQPAVDRRRLRRRRAPSRAYGWTPGSGSPLTGAIWAGSLVFAALGVAIGYLASGDAVRPITMIIYFGLSILGGLWLPATAYPQWLQNIAGMAAHPRLRRASARPSNWAAPRTPKDVAILVGYFLIFAGGAAWLYRKDTLKA